jgi:hypothetical protein
MIYEEVKEAQAKFEASVGSYIVTHPLQSYREIGLAVGLPLWKVAAIAKLAGIHRLGGHPGRRSRARKKEEVNAQA